MVIPEGNAAYACEHVQVLVPIGIRNVIANTIGSVNREVSHESACHFAHVRKERLRPRPWQRSLVNWCCRLIWEPLLAHGGGKRSVLLLSGFDKCTT